MHNYVTATLQSFITFWVFYPSFLAHKRNLQDSLSGLGSASPSAHTHGFLRWGNSCQEQETSGAGTCLLMPHCGFWHCALGSQTLSVCLLCHMMSWSLSFFTYKTGLIISEITYIKDWSANMYIRYWQTMESAECCFPSPFTSLISLPFLYTECEEVIIIQEFKIQ